MGGSTQVDQGRQQPRTGAHLTLSGRPLPVRHGMLRDQLWGGCSTGRQEGEGDRKERKTGKRE